MNNIPVLELIKNAIEARRLSYSPYSNYCVGAALLSTEGEIYRGCNIESAVFTPTSCAERTALVKAVSEGVTHFSAVAVVGSPKGENITQYAFPCGVCRQMLREFVDPKTFVVITARSEDDYKIYTLDELLPESFGPENVLV